MKSIINLGYNRLCPSFFPISLHTQNLGPPYLKILAPSGLPDCLLHVIISSIWSLQAVQTSVLSRRWRNLWRGVPVVDIEEREFAGDGQTWKSFEDFANYTLTSILPGTRLDAFRLHLARGSWGGATSSRWIRRGLRHLLAAVNIHATEESQACYAANAGLWQLRGLSVCAAGFVGTNPI